MRLAIVHDWLTGLRGGERVLDAVLCAYPDADVYTLVHRPGTTTERIDRRVVARSLLDHVPGIGTHYRKWLPLFPWAARRLSIEGYDRVLSISHAVAKSVHISRGTPHLCYCLTPMRYVFDQADAYLGHGPRRWAAEPLAAALRSFDVAHANEAQVTRFAAISNAVAERIQRHYDRTAAVIHPPVAVDRIEPSGRPPEDFFLLVGGFVPYKREAIVLDAFRESGLPLMVVGDGPARSRLEAKAAPNVRFLGRVDDTELARLFGACRALLYPQEEDFGIAAVEAQAAGRPVIAFGRGGVRDSVLPMGAAGGAPATGIFFDEQSSAGVRDAVARFIERERDFDPKAIRAHAEGFSTERFLFELGEEMDRLAG